MIVLLTICVVPWKALLLQTHCRFRFKLSIRPYAFRPFFWPIVDVFIIIGTNKAKDELIIGPREVTQN